jgi:hypothetical protein
MLLVLPMPAFSRPNLNIPQATSMTMRRSEGSNCEDDHWVVGIQNKRACSHRASPCETSMIAGCGGTIRTCDLRVMRDEVKNYISFVWCRFRRYPHRLRVFTCTQSCTQIENSTLRTDSGRLHESCFGRWGRTYGSNVVSRSYETPLGARGSG